MRHDDLYTPKRRAIIERFKALADRKGWGLRTVGPMIGMSREAASRLLRCKYPSPRVPDLVLLLEKRLAREKLRDQLQPEPDYVQTSVSEAVIDACYVAHVERALALVLGNTGDGKTRGAREFVRLEPDSAYVVAGPGATHSTIIRHLARRFECDPSGPSYEVRLRLGDKLRDRDLVILVDECDEMTDSCREMLRVLHDEARIGMVFIGTHLFLERMRRRRSLTADQFLGRVAIRRILGGVSREDLARIAAQYDLDAECLELLVDNSAGQARRAWQAIRAAHRIEQSNGAAGKIAAKHLRQAFATELPPPDLE
jgi:hypothetical protein